jgi:predicted CopG family antitoxin
MCGALKQQFHPWIKPMKRVPNKSLKQLLKLFPNTKEDDLEVLDKIITDRELEELLEAHGFESK